MDTPPIYAAALRQCGARASMRSSVRLVVCRGCDARRLQRVCPPRAEARVTKIEHCDTHPEAEAEVDAERAVELLGVVLECRGHRSPGGHFEGSETTLESVATRRQDRRSIADRDTTLQRLI